jgi:hypothetical protein
MFKTPLHTQLVTNELSSAKRRANSDEMWINVRAELNYQRTGHQCLILRRIAEAASYKFPIPSRKHRSLINVRAHRIWDILLTLLRRVLGISFHSLVRRIIPRGLNYPHSSCFAVDSLLSENFMRYGTGSFQSVNLVCRGNCCLESVFRATFRR